MKKNIFILLLGIVLSACSTSKQTNVLNYSTPLPAGSYVEIIGLGQTVQKGAKFLGSISVGDSGFTSQCSYQEVIRDAMNLARGMGGNIVQITEHKEPDLWSTCHRIKADVYYITKDKIDNP